MFRFDGRTFSSVGQRKVLLDHRLIDRTFFQHHRNFLFDQRIIFQLIVFVQTVSLKNEKERDGDAKRISFLLCAEELRNGRDDHEDKSIESN